MASTRRRPRVFRLDVPMPGPRLTAIQFLLSGLDSLIAASVLWTLLPSGQVGFLYVVTVVTATLDQFGL